MYKNTPLAKIIVRPNSEGNQSSIGETSSLPKSIAKPYECSISEATISSSSGNSSSAFEVMYVSGPALKSRNSA